MPKIHILAPELISQIAAGEVIERPASAVKELIENSLDAGATRITVSVSGGGLEGLRIVDDGCGMSAEDAPLAFERHATSKIANLNDLMKLNSLGFRGEALASLASVAHVELRTRARGERVGTKVLIEAGKILMVQPFACPEGTDLQIRALFDPVPARKKYMKTEATEYGHIFDTVHRIALAYPHVGLTLLKEGEFVFELPVGQSLLERTRDLFGGETARALLPVYFAQSNCVVSGFLGKPELSRKSNKYQFLFVNGHAVENRLIARAVQDAFHSLLMTDQHPWWILDVQMDPAFVDVNVHPRKLEVRFLNTQEMYRIIFGAAQHTLQKTMLSPVLDSPLGLEAMPKSNELSSDTQFAPALVPTPITPNLSFFSLSSSEETAPVPASPLSAPLTLSAQNPSFELKGMALKPLAQLARRYIVAESPTGLVLIDQHAAHERVRYERLMAAAAAARPLQQALLTPLQLDFGVAGAQLLREHRAVFLDLGYAIEEFGGSTFLLRSVPQGFERRDPERFFKEVLADLSNDRHPVRPHQLKEALLTSTACRGAIMFGDALTMIEMEALLKDMESTPNCTHCPHGRPAVLTWTHEKLEELFKRRNF